MKKDVVKGELTDPERWFGENLRIQRETVGLSQSDLAGQMAELGFSFHQTTIRRIETGERAVRLGEAHALAQLVETSVTELSQAPIEARMAGLEKDLSKSLVIFQRLIDGVVANMAEVLILAGHPRDAATHLEAKTRAHKTFVLILDQVLKGSDDGEHQEKT